MREEFENWCREHFGWDESRFDMHGGEYINGKTFEKWECWQASRATMVANITVHEEFDKRMYAINVYKELDRLGVSYE